MTERSWIPELSWSGFADVIGIYWGALVPAVAVAVLALALVWKRTRPAASGTLRAAWRDPSIAALVSLAAMPLALVLLSVLQPVMLPRYAVAAILAWAPLVAVAVQLLPRAARVGALVVFVFLAFLAIGAQIGVQRQLAGLRARDQLLLLQACADGEVVFLSREMMYSHLLQIRGECPRARYLAMAPATLDRLFVGPNERVRRLFRTENEFAALHGRLYGFPAVTSAAALDSLDHFVVMAQPSEIPRDDAGREFFSRLVFPRHRPTPLNGNGILYRREGP